MTDMHPDWIKEKMQAMRETIEALEAERDKAEVDKLKAYREGWNDGYAKRPQGLHAPH